MVYVNKVVKGNDKPKKAEKVAEPVTATAAPTETKRAKKSKE